MRFLFLLFLGFPTLAGAQTAALPAGFYQEKTPVAQVHFLQQAILDSLNAGALGEVPSWCHVALALAKTLPQDSFSYLLNQYLGDAYDATHTDSAALYYRRALSGLPAGNAYKQMYLEQSLLYNWLALDNRDSVLAYIFHLKEHLKPLPAGDTRRLKVLNTIASSYSSLNQYAASIQTFQEVIKAALKVQDTNVLLNAFVNIGSAYNQSGNDKLALEYTLQAIPYTGNDIVDQMVVWGNLTDYYSANLQYDSARKYLQKAEQAALQTGDEAAIHFIELRRVMLLLSTRKFSAAAPILEKSMHYYRQQVPPDVNVVNCYVLTATLDTALGNFEAANVHLKELYALTRPMNTKAFTATNLDLLALVNGRLGNYKEAFEYAQEARLLNDSIKTEEAATQFATLQAEYGMYQKGEQISALQKEARIQDLELRSVARSRLFFIFATLLLLLLAGGLLYVRTLRNREKMRHQKAELEMKALRSQMNPHFIFNSLNSVQKYIWEARREEAADYLTQFARLIRMVLENSMHATIKLSEELVALRLYIAMEHRRNNQQFDYRISVAPDINPEEVQLPPLLLQPYVENAIWHGLSPKEESGQLLVSIAREGESLLCVISDNGIGRAAAAALKSGKGGQNKSMALNISSARIEWLREDLGAAAHVEVADGFADGQATGTTVRIILPFIPQV